MRFLNDQDRAKLRVQHKQERDKRVADRIKAVLLYDRGRSTQQIAEALFISDQAIRDHIEDYKTAKKLAPESGGSEEKLSKEQSAQLESHLREGRPFIGKAPINSNLKILNNRQQEKPF